MKSLKNTIIKDLLEPTYESLVFWIQVLGFIQDNSIENVVFLTGDVHSGAINRISQPGEVGTNILSLLTISISWLEFRNSSLSFF